MKIQKHNPRKSDFTTLISAGTLQFVSADNYVAIVECHGLDPKGDDQSFRVTITRNELAHILKCMEG
jgi:hypothetical protein